MRRLTNEYLDHQKALDPVLLEHLRHVKQDEVKFRRLFEDAYASVWWKLAYPVRWLERVFHRAGRD